jgi:ribosomal protein S18 acetylase RimI-like enzyme
MRRVAMGERVEVTGLSIRSMRQEHIEGVRDLVRLSFDETPVDIVWEEEVAKRFGHVPNLLFLDVTRDGAYGSEIAGVAVMEYYRTTTNVGAGDVEVKLIAVHPEFRRRGYGRMLIKQGLRYFVSDAEAETIAVRLRAGDTATRSFFENTGLDRFREEPGFYPDGQDAVVLWCSDVRRPGMMY